MALKPLNNELNRKLAGEITFQSSKYDVYLDLTTRKVYVSKKDNPALSNIHFPGFTAANSKEALGKAVEMLRSVPDTNE